MEIWIGFTRIYDIQLSHCHLHMPPCCLRVWSLFSSDITTETWKGINEWLEQLNRTHWGDPLFALGIPVSHCLWSDLLDLKIVCVMEDPMSWHFGSHQPFFPEKNTCFLVDGFLTLNMPWPLKTANRLTNDSLGKLMSFLVGYLNRCHLSFHGEVVLLNP